MATQTYLLNNLLVETQGTVDTNLISTLTDSLLITQAKLQQFAESPEFANTMTLAFGNSKDVSGFQASWLSGEFNVLSGIEIIDANGLNGANGAYAVSTDRIYISLDFLKNHQDDPQGLVNLLLEEAGHRIDARLNVIDTPGDEGAIFAAIVNGESLSDERLALLKAENDQSVIVLDGKAIEIEKQDFWGDAGGIITNDFIVGTAGNDTINPGLGHDNVDGGDGTDTLIVDYSANDNTGTSQKGLSSSNASQNNGSGNILAYKGDGFSFDQVIYSNIEQLNITGTKYDDNIIGGIGNDTLKGGAGNDTLDGSGGVDILDGGDGIDSIVTDLSSSNGNNNLNFIQASTTAANGTQFENIEQVNLTTSV